MRSFPVVTLFCLAAAGHAQTPTPAVPPCPAPDALQRAARQYLDPDIEIGRVQPFAAGLWCEVEVRLRGERRIIYTDPAGAYGMLGPVVDFATGRNLTREALAELNRFGEEDLAALAQYVAFSVGSGGTEFYFVVDPHCRYCKEGEKVIEALAAQGLVTARFVLFPLNETSRRESASILCESKGYAEYKANYAAQTPCEAGLARLDASAALLRRHGIASTPTYILADGRLHSGWLAEAPLRELLGLPPAAPPATPSAPPQAPGTGTE